MSYVRAAVAAAVIALCASCTPRLYEACDVYSGKEYIGFRAKKGRCVYQILKRDDEAWIEMARKCGAGIDWVPVKKCPITPEIEEIFGKVKEEQRTTVDISALID